MSTPPDFQIINALHAHDGPIRCATIRNNGEIVTGCQSDAPNFRRWSQNADSVEENGESIPHDHWVTAITSLAEDISRDFFPEGCIITGCQDSNIRIFSLNGELLETLPGHGKGVISFSWTVNNQLVSGSWDGTAKLWDLTALTNVLTLGPHENGVQVLGLANGFIATTSTGESVNGKPANFKLRIWDPATGKQVGDDIQDHAGSIRCIAPLPAIDGFATTSNDGAVVMRSIDGQPIDVMTHPETEDGSAAFVFGCCALESEGGMEVVSCGEDGSVLVWRDAELVQSLRHPCCVWAVKAIPNSGGDFLTCGDDGVLRIFSRNHKKTSTAQALQLNQEFELEVAEAQKRRHKGPSQEEIAKAPKWERRGETPGRSEQQVMVFNKDGEIVAAQWISGAWVIVGTVTGSGDGGYVNEVWYDHVMPVEIEGPRGVQTLQLGHNNGENPFVAAQRFIDANEMSQGYLAQIADWITARSGQTMPTIGSDQASIVPTAQSSRSTASSNSNTTPPPARIFSYRVTSLTTYDDIPPLSKLLTKVTEFSNGQMDCSFIADIASLEALTKTLGETSYYHSSRLSVSQLQSLLTPLLQWDAAQCFPLFDVLRVVAIHPNGADTLSAELHGRLLLVYQRALELMSGAGQEEVPFATVLTAARFVCNCVKMESLRHVCYAESMLMQVLTALLAQVKHHNKLVRAAVSRIVMNIAGFASNFGVFAKHNLSPEAVGILLEILSSTLVDERESVEVIYNALRALGTLEINEKLPAVSALRENFQALLCSVQQQWPESQLGDAPTACLKELLVLFQ